MHSRLDALKRTWEQYVAGERDNARQFRERVTDFKAKTKDLGNQHLIKLLDAIALVAGKLPDPYPREKQTMVIEMASAFLLVEHVIDHFSSPADDLEVQIVIMGGWLLDAANGKSSGEPPAGLRPDLTERIGALQLRDAASIDQLLEHLGQQRRGTRRPLVAIEDDPPSRRIQVVAPVVERPSKDGDGAHGGSPPSSHASRAVGVAGA